MSKFEIYRGNDSGEECWRWRLVDADNNNIARSEEPFLKNSIRRSIKTIQSNVSGDTPVFLDESENDSDNGYRFEYFQGGNEKWYWRLKSGNHEIMAIGGEGFESEKRVEEEIEYVKEVIINAEIVFGKFEIYRGNDSGEECWRWRLVDADNNNIARSEEPFLKNSIRRSIKTIQSNVSGDTPVFLDESENDSDNGYRFEYFQGGNEKWYWRLKSGNHEIMAIGGEGFESEKRVEEEIEYVKEVIINAEIVFGKFEIYRGNDSGEECWRWRLVDADNNNIARSEEPFLKNSIRRSIKTIQSNVSGDTPVFLDESENDSDNGYRFEYFQGGNEKWYWRLKSGNHEIMAIGGEDFESEKRVEEEIEHVKEVIIDAEIVFENPDDDPAKEAKEQDNTEEQPTIPPGS